MIRQFSFSRLSECGSREVVSPWALPRNRRPKRFRKTGPYPLSYRWKFFSYRPPGPRK